MTMLIMLIVSPYLFFYKLDKIARVLLLIPFVLIA